MKIKTSITISDDVLKDVDDFSKPSLNRSEFIESAVRRFIEHLKRKRRNAEDLKIMALPGFEWVPPIYCGTITIVRSMVQI